MCKSRTITYSCSCSVTFRLSTCTGTYTASPRRQPSKPVILCKAVPSLIFKSSSPCGPCSKAALELEMSKELNALRHKSTSLGWGAEASDEDLNALADAEARFEAEQWKLNKQFPDGRFKKSLSKRGQQPSSESIPGIPDFEEEKKLKKEKRRSSLLREEVKVDDILPTHEPNTTSLTGGWSDNDWGSGWGTTWKSLSEEIEENDAARSEIGLSSNSIGTDAWEAAGRNKIPEQDDMVPSFEIDFPDVAYEPPSALDEIEIDEPADVRERSPSIVSDEGYESGESQQNKENENDNQKPATVTRPVLQRRTTSYIRKQAERAIQDLKAAHGCSWAMAVAS